MTEPAISQAFGGAAIIAVRQLGRPPDAIRPVLCLYCRTDKFVYWPSASRLRLANFPRLPAAGTHRPGRRRPGRRHDVRLAPDS